MWMLAWCVQDVDVAAELVRLGHAVHINAVQSAVPTSDSHGQQVNQAAR